MSCVTHPRLKKLNAYDRDHRYRYEYRNHAVRTWARGKKRGHRLVRRTLRQELQVAANLGAEFDNANAVRVAKSTSRAKAGVVTLKTVVEANACGVRLIY